MQNVRSEDGGVEKHGVDRGHVRSMMDSISRYQIETFNASNRGVKDIKYTQMTEINKIYTT